MGINFNADRAWCAEPEKEKTYTYDAGLKLGYGESFNTKKGIDVLAVLPYFHWTFHEFAVDSKTTLGLGLVVEGTFFYYTEPQETIGVGLSPLLRFDLKLGYLTPYLQGGVGILWTDLDVHELGQEFNFTPQGEAGLEFPLSQGYAFSVGYRYHHISNAGLNERNGGINTNLIVVGLSKQF